MKKKLIITSSLITILLALFPVSLYAEEVIQDPAPANSFNQGVLLDSYFYQNYDLLPYIESSGSQYINTGIIPSGSLSTYVKFSLLNGDFNSTKNVFGAVLSGNHYQAYVNYTNEKIAVYIMSGVTNYSFDLNNEYLIHELVLEPELVSLDNEEHVIDYTNISNNKTIYIFNKNALSDTAYISMRLYSFNLYDSSANDGDGAYVRYYYPAQAKTSGAIGLYDAVSKTFFPSIGTDPFENPTEDKVLNFQISDFITAGLTWIGNILDFVIATPIILFFLAIGLAGAMYRWARRIVHF